MAQKKTVTQRKPAASKRKIQPSPIPPSAALENARISDEDIAVRAYFLWECRGKPLGSPEEDWHKAAEQLLAALQQTA
jgi:hypothetical protein